MACEDSPMLTDGSGANVEWTIESKTSVTFQLNDTDGTPLDLTGRVFHGRFALKPGQAPVLVKTLANQTPLTDGKTVLTVDAGDFSEPIDRLYLQIFERVSTGPDVFERIARYQTKVVQDIPAS